ncbi:MAG TPA: SemiSWEET family transporter [Bacteroidales bacterium]|nr:SemiSWEET family transporter [Bacteroidales bacterium]
MNPIEIIGFAAGGLVSVSLLPQVIKSWRTKSTKDIALSWTLINLSGQILWIIYGQKIHSEALVIMSIITLFMVGIVIILKLIHG